MRLKIVALAFPEQKEGTNTLDLPNAWKLKAVVKIERKVDEAVLPAAKEQLQKMLINPDPLIRYKPELATKEYRELARTNDEARKIFDMALTIKYGSPTLELIPPKQEKK
jgi:hypothetical protein